MKTLTCSLITLGFILISQFCISQQTAQDPWKPNQLMAPADLAAIITSTSETKPVILSIGPSAYIKGSIDIGDVKEKVNLDKKAAGLSAKRMRTNYFRCKCEIATSKRRSTSI